MSDLKSTIKIKKDHIPFDPDNPDDVRRALKRLDNVTTASGESYHCNNGTRPYYKSTEPMLKKDRKGILWAR